MIAQIIIFSLIILVIILWLEFTFNSKFRNGIKMLVKKKKHISKKTKSNGRTDFMDKIGIIIGRLGLVNIISFFVTLLVGVSLIGPISKQISNYSTNVNDINSINATTTFNNTAIQYVPVLFALGILVAAFAFVTSTIRGLRESEV